MRQRVWQFGSAPKQRWKGLALLAFLIVSAVVIAGGYLGGWGWTGLTSFNPSPQLPPGFEPQKTLWDWLQLLIVPGVLAAGALWFNSRTKERDEAAAEERFREEALQKYFDTMTELLLDKHLMTALKQEAARRKAQEESEGTSSTEPPTQPEVDPAVIDVARVRTVNILRRMRIDDDRLDQRRINDVLDFLRDADLYEGETAILRGALMRGINLGNLDLAEIGVCNSDLSQANLRRANFREANLQGARMVGADLEETRLIDANLQGANLQSAILEGAYMLVANLQGADLGNANLQRANLWKANLQGASLGGANLEKAKLQLARLQGANLSRVRLQEASLEESQMQNAFLGSANLQGANLLNANLQGANVWGWICDIHTLLPDGKFWTEELSEQELTERFGVVFKKPGDD